MLLPFPLNVNYVSGIMAQDKYFKKEGLSVTFQTVDGSPVLVQQMVAGRADFGVSGTSAVLTADAHGGDLRGIAVNRHDASAVLSVPADSPIKSIAELRGKNIGIPSLSDGSVAVVTAALADAGLTVGDDVHLVVVGEGGPAVAEALKNDRIAAYSAGVSDQPGLEVGGDIKLRSIMPAKYAGLPDTVFVTTQKVLDDPSQRAVAIKLARALVEGAAAAKANPRAAVAAGCRMFPEQCKNKAYAPVAVRDGVYSDNPTPGNQPAYMNPAKMKVYVNALVASKQIPGGVNIATTMPNTYVKQIAEGVGK